ncbi:sensor histidine kinase [Actinomadura graeca]|uniref:histidine kinase n=1 Tax=Actinomadura graeca TaxID=2750812 RepID=A0ABX8R609_9ACTN|nr:hypothetical protein [Actinomadura graeca]QXJ25849.1 sensor histidine kinase [Actinomadura graeca]
MIAAGPSTRARSGGDLDGYATRLVECLAGLGLRAAGRRAGSALADLDAMTVTAHQAEVVPSAGRCVVLLPGPGPSAGLYWHWLRGLRGHWPTAHWFQPFCPAEDAGGAAAAIAAAIEAEQATRARLEHASLMSAAGTAPGPGGGGAEAPMLSCVGRPLTTLTHRLLSQLKAVEDGVENPELLHRLFGIDHLATRIMRLTGRLAVLSGQAGRTARLPVPLATVLRQAVAEVEHFSRIRVAPAGSAVALPGHAADVILMLAELAENATVFSPPDTQVRICAARTPVGLNIEIADHGLPISVGKRTALNRLLALPDLVDVHEQVRAGQIGLLVAALVAQRHGITITLLPRRGDAWGTCAVVEIPAALLVAPVPPRSLAWPAGAGAVPAATGRPHRPAAAAGPAGSGSPPPAPSPEALSEVDGARPVLPQRGAGGRAAQDPAPGRSSAQSSGQGSAVPGSGPARGAAPVRDPDPALMAAFIAATRPPRRRGEQDPPQQGPPKQDSSAPSGDLAP